MMHGDFSTQTALVRDMLKANTIRDLLQMTEIAMKKILRCQDIHFMLMDKETITHFHEEHGKTSSIYVNFCPLHVVMPENYQGTKDSFQFTPHFALLSEILKAKSCEGKTCVWPVKSQRSTDTVLLLIQGEHKGAMDPNNAAIQGRSQKFIS